MRLSTSLLFLFPSASLATLAPWPSDMQLRLNEGEVVHTTGAIDILEKDPFGGEPPTTIFVSSDVPVIAERLTAGTSAFLEGPIPYGQALVIVKSSGCEEGSVTVTVRNTTLENGHVQLEVTTNTDPITDILDSSALVRQLQCISQVAGDDCQFGPSSGGSDGEVVEREEVTTNNGETTTTNGETTATNGETTTTNGETPIVTSANGEATTPVPAPVKEEPVSQANRKMSILLTMLLVGISTLFTGRSTRGTSLVLLGMGAALFLATGSTTTITTTTTFVSASRELQQCTVNVEVVYWGCDIVLNATAPALELRNLNLETTRDLDICNCTSVATFPDPDIEREEPIFQYLDFDADNTVSVEGDTQQVAQAGASNCMIAIGRPFRDEEGASIASTSQEETKAMWSSSSDLTTNANLWKHYNGVPPNGQGIAPNGVLAQEWTTRALGEHASVASFSAFTIALMSNSAPPLLIQDSLTAAQDELRHAQISFQVATLLTGKPVGPSPLPSSSLSFESDLMTLAKGVIEEGCVDETLSALQMAADVDSNSNSNDQWMWNITKKIAIEEGRHSILAWKTAQWICEKDASICSELKKDLLQKERLLAAGEGKHDSNSVVFKAWSCMAGDLACHVSGGADCTKEEACDSLTEKAAVTELVNQIMAGVKQAESVKIA